MFIVFRLRKKKRNYPKNQFICLVTSPEEIQSATSSTTQEHLPNELIQTDALLAEEESMSIDTEQPIKKKRKHDKKKNITNNQDLDDQCLGLGLEDPVPNKAGLQVTLKEILEKTEKNEGYVEEIVSHRNIDGDTSYCVKWIVYKKLTWEMAVSISGDIITKYWEKRAVS